MVLNNIEEIVVQEFVCFYHADLIDENWGDKCVQEDLAKGSVVRLLSRINEPVQLLELFERMVVERQYPMNQTLSKETEIEWMIEDEDWISYRTLLETMIVVLKSKI
ncbi:hypothetical protein [uncultured Shewanella sp.]|uniref:hypothetical protein n=1 Tax=uncultured Shewanella sp. TaxID=173975 RepID=UPI00261722C2|nr:hypothetical protein [uncultured Shewanella sp.]